MTNERADAGNPLARLLMECHAEDMRDASCREEVGRIEKVVKKLKVQKERENHIPISAYVLWSANLVEHDQRWYQRVGSASASAILDDLARAVRDLVRQIGELPMDVREVLDLASSGNDDSSIAMAKGEMAVPLGETEAVLASLAFISRLPPGVEPTDITAIEKERLTVSVRAIPSLHHRREELIRFEASIGVAKRLLEAAPTTHEGPVKKKAAYITGQAAHQFTLLTGEVVRRNRRPKDGKKRKSEFVKFLDQLFACMGIDASAENMTKDFLAQRKERLAE